jgi:hypothetical protein
LTGKPSGLTSKLSVFFSFEPTAHTTVKKNLRPVRLAYQPPANSTFLSEQTSHQQPVRTSQQYSSLRTNQHQPSATSQPNRPLVQDFYKVAREFLITRRWMDCKELTKGYYSTALF